MTSRVTAVKLTTPLSMQMPSLLLPPLAPGHLLPLPAPPLSLDLADDAFDSTSSATIDILGRLSFDFHLASSSSSSSLSGSVTSKDSVAVARGLLEDGGGESSSLEVVRSLKLDNVWVFVQLIFGHHWSTNQQEKNPNIS